MRISLGFKILASYTVIILISLGLAVGVGNKVTRQGYDDYSVQMDDGRARVMSRLLSDWLFDALQAREEGREPDYNHPIFVAPEELSPPGEEIFHPRNSDGFMGIMVNRMDMNRMMGPAPPVANGIVVTDSAGYVVLDTAGYNNLTLDPKNHHGVIIRHDGRNIGHLFLGNMIPGSPRPRDTALLRSAGIMTWIIAGIIFIFATVLGLLLTRHIITPVKALNIATTKAKTGDLSVRVPEGRKDELGDLSRGFNAMTDALEKADSQRRRLIADSAHELRTPVSLIRARIEMMEEGVYPMDAEGLAALSGESDRLVKLVEELRVLADLESPETRSEKSPMDVDQLIEDVLSAVKPKIDQSGIRIETESISKSVSGNSGQLHRLLSNLLNNAFHYAELKIRITSLPVAAGVEISVEDDGPGIPEADRELVFDRYYRVDTSRSRDSGGSGLGLAICREIAKGHGGRINADVSLDLGGAKLKVFIPED